MDNKDRSLKELYIVLLKYLETKPRLTGICSAISCLYHRNLIYNSERIILYNHFITIERPNTIWLNLFHRRDRKLGYYWNQHLLKPRIKFIKKIIESL